MNGGRKRGMYTYETGNYSNVKQNGILSCALIQLQMEKTVLNKMLDQKNPANQKNKCLCVSLVL